MMKIAVYQFFPEFGKKEKNIEKIEQAILSTDADLVVLPELCSTGYQFVSMEEVNTLCEPIPDGITVKAFTRICRQKGIYIVGGVGELDGISVYNSAVLTGPNGFMGVYRKVHLFDEEKIWFKPGDLGFPVWDIGKVKIGMIICFDWIFPESARSLALQGADIICHPANLVLPFCQDAMITRAIENRIFTVTANRVGYEERQGKKRFQFTGGSQVVSPSGEILFRMDGESQGIQEVEIDPGLSRDKNITSRNHLWDDRNPLSYINVKGEVN
jgi:predicted amidohydrolase